jgi:hypothetical protein
VDLLVPFIALDKPHPPFGADTEAAGTDYLRESRYSPPAFANDVFWGGSPSGFTDGLICLQING